MLSVRLKSNAKFIFQQALAKYHVPSREHNPETEGKYGPSHMLHSQTG